jgi:hypothetical protein
MAKVSALLLLLSLFNSEANERNLRTVARARPQGTKAISSVPTPTPTPVPKTPAPTPITPKSNTPPPVPIILPKSITPAPISTAAPLRGIYTSFPSTSPSAQLFNHQGTKAISNVISPAPTPLPVAKTPAPIRTTPKPNTPPPVPILPPKSVTPSPISIVAPLRGIYTSFPSTSPSAQILNHQGTKAVSNLVSPAPTPVPVPKTPAPTHSTPKPNTPPPVPIIPPKSVTPSPISIVAPLRGIYTSFPSTSPSAHVGTVTGRDAALPMDLPSPEAGFQGLPKMETVPAGVEGKTTFIPPKTDDLVDSPNASDGGVTDSQSISEIPAMEKIPNSIKATPPFITDAVDMPFVIGDTPVLLPFGNSAESYVLHQTASVCATSEQVAFSRCEQEPVCKYVTHDGGVVTSELKSGQGDCIRRCDAPLGEAQCEPHEQCFHFVLTCKVYGW